MRKLLILATVFATLTSGAAEAQFWGRRMTADEWAYDKNRRQEMNDDGRNGRDGNPPVWMRGRGGYGGGYYGGQGYGGGGWGGHHHGYGGQGYYRGGHNAMIGMAMSQVLMAFAQAQREQAIIAQQEARMQHLQQAIAQNRAQTQFLAHRKYPVRDSGINAYLGDQAVIWYPSLEYQRQGPAYLSISTGEDGFFVEVSEGRYLAIYEMLQSKDPAQIEVVLTELLGIAKRGHLIF